jgi:hypothetical protein
MRVYGLLLFLAFSQLACGQSFEIQGIQESFKGIIGETIKAPIRIKNTTDKTIYLIIRRIHQEIGTTQKSYLCIDQQCHENRSDDYILKVDPKAVTDLVSISLEAGLVPIQSSIKYVVINKNLPAEINEFDLNFSVEETRAKERLYSSRFIQLNNIYPNPVTDFAFVDYRILEHGISAKIVIHNILGNPMTEFPLPFEETKVKMTVESLSAGIYFYTLYIDNEGVTTRKLVIKK